MTVERRIAAWLPGARWFAAKGAAAERLEIHDSVPIPGTSIVLELVAVAGDRYAVPVVDGRDAAADFAAWLAGAVLRADRTSDGRLRGHPCGRAPLAPVAAATVRQIGGDASNTCFVVACGPRRLVVKLLRRCRPGIHPEVEVGEFLAGVWEGVPAFRGWLEYAAGGESTALATVHDFVPDCAPAWDRLLGLLDGGLTSASRVQVLDLADLLGRVTAGMHAVLGARSDRPAFAPERPTPAFLHDAAARMAAHADAVLDLASRRADTSPPVIARGLAALGGRREDVKAVLGSLAASGDVAALIRVHGDYHLGQVLLEDPGPRALVIDFEGEPGRPLWERRHKASVFKDLAGMCRSFDYLVRHAARRNAGPYQSDDVRLLEERFLAAYRSLAEGTPWWPADPAAADLLLRVFMLDKALYELAYELANRPEWVDVPLAALLAEE